MYIFARILLALGLAAVWLAGSALPAQAWYTKLRPGQRPTHFLLAMLNSDDLIHIGYYNQDALYKGSNEPDDHGLQDHNASARRCLQGFTAAVGQCAKGDKYWATRRLARSFHYLQDYGDPTDTLRKGRKDYVRKLAHATLLSNVKRDPYWQRSFNHFSNQVRGLDLSATLRYLNGIARARTDKINSIYNHWYQRGRRNEEVRLRDRSVQGELVITFGLIAACQQRVIALFQAECQARVRSRPSPPIRSFERPDYPSESTPRPPVQ